MQLDNATGQGNWTRQLDKTTSENAESFCRDRHHPSSKPIINCVCGRRHVPTIHLKGDEDSPFCRTAFQCTLSRVLLGLCPEDLQEHAGHLLISTLEEHASGGKVTTSSLISAANFAALAQRCRVAPVLQQNLRPCIPLENCSGTMTSFICLEPVKDAMKMLRLICIETTGKQSNTTHQWLNAWGRAWRSRPGPQQLPLGFPEEHREQFQRLLNNPNGNTRTADAVKQSVGTVMKRLLRNQAWNNTNFFMENDEVLQQAWNSILQCDANLHVD